MAIIPGQPDWLNMTGGQMEAMNRERCRSSPFGGMRDPTCADFSVDALGVGAPTDDSNRTAQSTLIERMRNFGISPLGMILGEGKELSNPQSLSARLGFAQTAGLNIGFVVLGLVIVVGGFILWASRSKSPVAVGIRQGANSFRDE